MKLRTGMVHGAMLLALSIGLVGATGTCFAVGARSETKVRYGGAWPRGWKFPGFDDSSWTSATFPLGENVSFCPQLASYLPDIGGDFPLNSRILTRNTFSLSDIPTSATIRVIVDNRGKLFVNGILVFDSGVLGGCENVSREHVVEVPKRVLRVGENVLAVVGLDMGAMSFLNVEMDYTCPGVVECDIIDGPTKALYDGDLPSGWKLRRFDDSSWTDVSFPLGNSIFCSELMDYLPLGGDFPLHSRVLTRNKFRLQSIPVSTTVNLVADNQARVFVNGRTVHSSGLQGGCGGVSRVWAIDIPLRLLKRGMNVVAVSATNFGVQSFVNVEMRIQKRGSCSS